MNLALSLLAAVERHPESEALIDAEARLSYAELHARATRGASGLAELGVGRGDRGAAMLTNSQETVELFGPASGWGRVSFHSRGGARHPMSSTASRTAAPASCSSTR